MLKPKTFVGQSRLVKILKNLTTNEESIVVSNSEKAAVYEGLRDVPGCTHTQNLVLHFCGDLR